MTSIMNDGLTNLTAGLGTDRDKAFHSVYVMAEADDNQLLTAYRSSWLHKKVVDIPVEDACRNWRVWMADKLEIEEIEHEEKRLGLREKVRQAMTIARLYGGAAILIGTGERDTSKELRPERVGKGGIRYLTVLNRRQIKPTELDNDPLSPRFMRPKAYQLQNSAIEVHPSRLIVFIGAANPDPELVTGPNFGWGDSVLLAMSEAIRNADSTDANVASLVFESKVDVIRIPGFMDGLQDKAYEGAVKERVRLASMIKGINGTLILDKEEEYESKSASFGTLPDIMDRFLQRVSGASDIPVTRLLGQSPSGLNSTGESDIRNYYDGIQAMQTLDIGPALALFDECLIRSATGTRLPEVHYRWRDLWQMSEKDRADIGKTIADTVSTLGATMLFPDEALSKAAVNALTESGTMPGLESEIKDFGAQRFDEEQSNGKPDPNN